MKGSPGRRHPPELQIRFIRNIWILMLINFIPITGGIYLIVQVIRGKLRLTHPEFIPGLIYILLFSIIMAVFVWLVVPVFKWARDYTYWQLCNSSLIIWFVPAAVSFLIWVIVAIVGLVIGALIILIAITTFLGIF